MNRFGSVLLLSILACVATSSAAQTYRWTDPATGRIVLSNQPPPAGIKPLSTRPVSPTEESQLPAALRDPVQRFPVTIYINGSCLGYCEQGRNLLVVRGIPFSEKTVTNPDVAAELKQLSGETAIPTLLVGRQASAGFDLARWNELLDLAGYPQRPVAGYRPAAPKPAAPPVTQPATEAEAAAAPAQ